MYFQDCVIVKSEYIKQNAIYVYNCYALKAKSLGLTQMFCSETFFSQNMSEENQQLAFKYHQIKVS